MKGPICSDNDSNENDDHVSKHSRLRITVHLFSLATIKKYIQDITMQQVQGARI